MRKIGSGLAELEAGINRFDSAAAEQTRLAGEVQKIAQQEAELLRDESLSEPTATKRLIEIRAKADVLRARAEAATERAAEQQKVVLELGANVRRTLARAAHAILQARSTRLLAMIG